MVALLIEYESIKTMRLMITNETIDKYNYDPDKNALNDKV